MEPLMTGSGRTDGKYPELSDGEDWNELTRVILDAARGENPDGASRA